MGQSSRLKKCRIFEEKCVFEREKKIEVECFYLIGFTFICMLQCVPLKGFGSAVWAQRYR